PLRTPPRLPLGVGLVLAVLTQQRQSHAGGEGFEVLAGEDLVGRQDLLAPGQVMMVVQQDRPDLPDAKLLAGRPTLSPLSSPKQTRYSFSSSTSVNERRNSGTRRG